MHFLKVNDKTLATHIGQALSAGYGGKVNEIVVMDIEKIAREYRDETWMRGWHKFHKKLMFWNKEGN